MLAKARSRRYSTWMMTDMTTLMTQCFWQIHLSRPNSCLHSLEWAAGGIGLHVHVDKTEFTCFNQTSDISTLNGKSLKLVDKFAYLGSSILSTKNYINTCLAKTWTAIDRLSVIWKSKLSDKIKCSFFPSSSCVNTAVWMLRMESKLDSNCTRMLQAVLNKSWGQNPTKQPYRHLLPISKTIQIRWARQTGHCWRSKSMDEQE